MQSLKRMFTVGEPVHGQNASSVFCVARRPPLATLCLNLAVSLAFAKDLASFLLCMPCLSVALSVCSFHFKSRASHALFRLACRVVSCRVVSDGSHLPGFSLLMARVDAAWQSSSPSCTPTTSASPRQSSVTAHAACFGDSALENRAAANTGTRVPLYRAVSFGKERGQVVLEVETQGAPESQGQVLLRRKEAL